MNNLPYDEWENSPDWKLYHIYSTSRREEYEKENRLSKTAAKTVELVYNYIRDRNKSDFIPAKQFLPNHLPPKESELIISFQAARIIYKARAEGYLPIRVAKAMENIDGLIEFIGEYGKEE